MNEQQIKPQAQEKREIRKEKEAVIRRLLITYLGWCFVVLVLALLLSSCSPYVQAATGTPETTPSPVHATNTSVSTLSVKPSPTPQTCTIQTGVPAGSLNLRSGKGTSYTVIKVLGEGETLTVITKGAWLEVLARGKHGFINSKYCK